MLGEHLETCYVPLLPDPSLMTTCCSHIIFDGHSARENIVTLNLFICFSLLNNAFEEQMAFQRALKEYVGSLDPSYAKENEELFVGFEGSFGNRHVTPRTLMSRFLGNLVCVEGIVTKCKLIALCDTGF